MDCKTWNTCTVIEEVIAIRNCLVIGQIAKPRAGLLIAAHWMEQLYMSFGIRNEAQSFPWTVWRCSLIQYLKSSFNGELYGTSVDAACCYFKTIVLWTAGSWPSMQGQVIGKYIVLHFFLVRCRLDIDILIARSFLLHVSHTEVTRRRYTAKEQCSSCQRSTSEMSIHNMLANTSLRMCQAWDGSEMVPSFMTTVYVCDACNGRECRRVGTCRR